MKMSDVRPGMRLESTLGGGLGQRFVTVTDLTERGFLYKLDARVLLSPRMGWTDGGEHFGRDGEAFYEPVK